MDQTPNWVLALNIKEEDYKEWLTLFPSKEFLLSWAIQNGHVDETTYLSWARVFYNLPLIKKDFFDQPPPLELWKKYIEYPWSPTVLPLAEWDGVVYIGCLEPTVSIEKGISHQFLLAPTTVQAKWWGAFCEVKKQMQAEVVAPPQTDRISVQASRPDTEMSFDQIKENPQVDLSIPDGIELSKEDLALHQSEETPPPPADDAAPSGLDLSAHMAQVESLTPEMRSAPQGLAPLTIAPVDTSSVENIILKPLTVELPKLSIEANASTPAQAPTPAPPPPPVLRPLPSLSPISSPPQAPPPHPVATPMEATPVHDTTPGTPDDIIRPIFEKMKSHFERSMVLLYEGSKLRPYQWDSEWPLVRTMDSGIDIQSPSLFRIVAETVGPYHGYVRPAESHEIFFKKWNSGKYPEHITAVPLRMSDGMSIGVLLGLSSIEKDLSSLAQCQNLAAELTEKLKINLELASQAKQKTA